MFCFPAVGAKRRSETFPSLSRLFTFTLWSRLTFAILFPSSRNILRNILHLSPPVRSSTVSLHAPSRTFAVAVHKVFRVYADYLFENLFAFAGSAGMLFSRKFTFLPSFLSQHQYLLPAEFQPTRYLAIARKRKALAASLNYFVNKPGDGNGPLEPSHCKLNTS